MLILKILKIKIYYLNKNALKIISYIFNKNIFRK